MTKLAAIVAALSLFVVVGGTAIYTMILARSDRATCGISTALGADIGGPFALVNTKGETVTDEEVLNRPSLVYFGYTFCPDVCPFDVARNALAVDIIEEQGIDFGHVFITIDPNRDTSDELARYAEAMHPHMIALTGSDQQIQDAATAYRAFYARGEGEGQFYLMDHTTHTYLMLPDGQFGGFFRREDTAETIAEKSACLINTIR